MGIKNTPNCIGVIMDGNRRWAKEQGLPTLKGHQEGHRTFVNFVDHAYKRGIKNLIFYAFSTENWNRTEEEVGYLMDLFEKKFLPDLEEIKKHNGRIRFIGERHRFSSGIQTLMKNAENETKDNLEGTVVIALSYGGRTEILDAVNRLLESGKESVTESDISEALWTKDFPDPDLIIRTGEAMRLSNFLPWQSVYSELYFTGTMWPDFDEDEFDHVLESFASRQRRYGK